MKKVSWFNKPSTKILLRYCEIALVFLGLCAILLPTLLNYAPGSINTPFDIKMSYISYTQQFFIVGIVVILSISIPTKILLKDIDDWYINKDNAKIYNNKKLISKIRKKCFNLPYLIFLFELIFPTIGISAVIFFTGSHHIIMLFKILIILLSFVFLLAVFTYIFSKDLYANILSSTYKEDINIGFRIGLKKKIFMQILPVFMTVILLTSFIGYSRAAKEKEDLMYTFYERELNQTFSSTIQYDKETIVNLLKNIDLYNSSDSRFLIFNDHVDVVSGNMPSDYLISYTRELSHNYNGRTYDSYGIDTQGATFLINTTDGPCYVCISYDVEAYDVLSYLIASFIFLTLMTILALYLFSSSLVQDISQVTAGLNSITDIKNTTLNKKLPVISNDEIGDLIFAFNKVQDLNNSNILQIKNNQDILMERERLASLGQLIGGIAHNLKTPIMSISGAAEGLTDLVKEYDSSIDDPEVNSQDHHDIAKDMSEWIVKIKEYTEYMSDIITAVKGQAVTLSETENISFNIDELVKRVDILMKHELKNALIYMNVQMNAPKNTKINGDINSLVQVINNMISNAIQAYNGKTEQNIDLILNKSDGNLIISVRDYGCGLPQKVQDKLFKEMITTKGKNGTGLGLYMSYSTIKAHFNGNITFESKEGEGTTFSIILPL